LEGEWFPSLFLLSIFPLGTISIPGLCVKILIITKPREKDKKRKRWKDKRKREERKKNERDGG
jgi:hypothetical protein